VFYIPEYVTLLPTADSALWKKKALFCTWKGLPEYVTLLPSADSALWKKKALFCTWKGFPEYVTLLPSADSALWKKKGFIVCTWKGLPEYVTLLPSADSALWKKRLYSALEKVCWVPTKQQQQQCDGRIVGGRVGRFVICLVRGRNG